MSHTC